MHSVECVLGDPLYYIRRGQVQDDYNSTQDIFMSSDMNSMQNISTDLACPGLYGYVFCNLLQFGPWYKSLAKGLRNSWILISQKLVWVSRQRGKIWLNLK